MIYRPPVRWGGGNFMFYIYGDNGLQVSKLRKPNLKITINLLDLVRDIKRKGKAGRVCFCCSDLVGLMDAINEILAGSSFSFDKLEKDALSLISRAIEGYLYMIDDHNSFFKREIYH